jgi:hypothetical protein
MHGRGCRDRAQAVRGGQRDVRRRALANLSQGRTEPPCVDATMVGVIELPEGSWWDWDLLHFDGSRLRLAAGHDLTYHHGLELVFTDVAYMACPTQFQDPRFREPTLDERAAVRRYIGEDAPLVVAFDIDTADGRDSVGCLVAAGSVEVVRGLVYRYWRDDLGPGERLAPHIRPAS